MAAGVGRRLQAVHAGPKALLAFGGRTLMARHVDALRACEVGRIAVVAGHERTRLRDAIGSIDRAVEIIDNSRFRGGSLASLACGVEVLRSGAPVLLMDADVLYDPALLRRLVESAHPDAMLLDRDIEPGEEPVKICLADGAVVDLAKRPERKHDRVGESVGFFRLSPATARALADWAERLQAEAPADTEHEAALRAMILDGSTRFGVEDITGLPWIEIDFPADIARALALLPRIDAAGCHANNGAFRWTS